MRSGSPATSGVDHSASISREALLEPRRADRPGSRDRGRAAARGGPPVCRARRPRPRDGSTRRIPGCPPAPASPLAASASCIDAMATSIIESSGCLVVMRLEPDARQVEPREPQRVAMLGARSAGARRRATAITGMSRMRPTMLTSRLWPDQQAEHQDAQDDEDDQELGAAAWVRGGVLAHVLDRRADPRARARGWSCARRRGTGRCAGSPPSG